MSSSNTEPVHTREIAIVHTRQHGTIVYGSVRGDGAGKILHEHRFHGSSNLEVPLTEELGEPYWYMPHSQRSSANRYYIDKAAEALRAAEWSVEIRIDDTTPAVGFAELEARKYEHADYRAERLENQASTAQDAAGSIRTANKRTYDALNGTPMLVDHYSYTRHKNLLDRLWKREGKAFALLDKAGNHFGRAQAARDFQGRREAHGTTLRRIQKLEKWLRDIDKRMDGRFDWYSLEPIVEGNPAELDTKLADLTARGIPAKRTGRQAQGCAEVWIGLSDHAQQVLAAEVVETVEEIAYWEDLIAASGRKVWGLADFVEGDFVGTGSRWMEVTTKAGRKSVTVPTRFVDPASRIQTMADLLAHDRLASTATIPYDKVNGKMTAQEARKRFPEAFVSTEEELPLRPSAKRGKVKIRSGGGVDMENWYFTIEGQDYRATWDRPEHTTWYGPPTPIAEPAPIKIFKTFGLVRQKPELVAELDVPAGIRWCEEVFNVLRIWVEDYARQQKTT
ncbi:DUF3560 domain-containing protein (plasmid) [Streptosporangium sp. NBC_01495]|uniref:DUF3560 domain-containing protein n=1 Tax=Streptosporangium sp. NBC_01495 TaxID=2903899 RepID=UPI002E31EA89|nr:DUF3560 domain-containing protein [Streptosporangium sp. NBC_01495]